MRRRWRGIDTVSAMSSHAVQPRRVAQYLRAAVIAVALLLTPAIAACQFTSGDGKKKCDTQECEITIDRGVDAKTEVLGADIKLDKVEGEVVTLTISGQEVVIPKGETGSAAGHNITIKEVNKDNVVIVVKLQ